MTLGGFDGNYDGKITIKQGQGITWAIADELGLDSSDLKKINGSIWQNIMNVVNDQKNSGGANYGGGQDLNGATNKNYVVNAGDVFTFTKENWNKIVGFVKAVLPDKMAGKELVVNNAGGGETPEGTANRGSGNVQVSAFKGKVDGETDDEKESRQAENLAELKNKMGEPPTLQQLKSAVDYLIGDEVLNLNDEEVKNLRTQLYGTKFDNEYLMKLAENAEKAEATKENLLALIRNIDDVSILGKINLNGLSDDVKAEVQKAIDNRKSKLNKNSTSDSANGIVNISKKFSDAIWRPGTDYDELVDVINNDINENNILELEKYYEPGHKETLIETVLFEIGLDYEEKRMPLIKTLAEYWFKRAEANGIDSTMARTELNELIGDTMVNYAKNNKLEFCKRKTLEYYYEKIEEIMSPIKQQVINAEAS